MVRLGYCMRIRRCVGLSDVLRRLEWDMEIESLEE
jgi:hypothetical protein